MRILETIAHPDIHISILYMNERFLVKLEAGPYEQIYKFTREMASDIEQVKKTITPEFIAACITVFDGMHRNFLKQVNG